MLMMVLIASCGGDTTTTSAAGATTTAAGVTTTAAAGVTTTGAPVSSTQYTILVGAPIQIPFYEAYVAVSQGFFEKRGLKVKVVAVDGADGQITGLASGVGNIMYDAVSTFLVPNAKEFNPIAFYMEQTNGLWDLVVPGNSPIQKMEELDGKVIGVTSPQDPGVNLVLNMNRVLGINATTLIVTDAMQAMAAFNRGDIAAFSGVVVDIAVDAGRGRRDAQHRHYRDSRHIRRYGLLGAEEDNGRESPRLPGHRGRASRSRSLYRLRSAETR